MSDTKDSKPDPNDAGILRYWSIILYLNRKFAKKRRDNGKL